MHGLSRLGVVSLWLAGACSGTTAEQSLSLAFENDGLGRGDDFHYTYGAQVSYSRDDPGQGWRALAAAVGVAREAEPLGLVLGLGLQAFTPEDIRSREPLIDDRPYAGWLYLSLGLAGERMRGRRPSLRQLDLILGVVGPDSAAEDMQRAMHRFWAAPHPRGWDHQLEREWTADLHWRQSWRLPLGSPRVDLVPQLQVLAGSSQRQAGGGLLLRCGDGLELDFGPALMLPVGHGSTAHNRSESPYWYLFAGAQGRYVDYNLFLDGDGNGENHRVSGRDWVGELQLGLVAGYGAWRLTVTSLVRSREFEGQGEPQQYGALSLTRRF